MTALALSVFAAGAALTDVRNNKIYNRYLLPGLIAGLMTGLATGGLAGAGERMISACLALILTLPVYLLRGLAAGDVKLLTALAAFFTAKGALYLIGISFVLTAAYGVIRILCLHRLRGRIHFAVPVFAGVLLLQIGGLV